MERDLTKQRLDMVWKVGVSPGGETLVVCGKRAGRTIVQMWKFDRESKIGASTEMDLE